MRGRAFFDVMYGGKKRNRSALVRRTVTTGSFVKVGSTSNTATTFTNDTVQGNQTYFYQVTCIDSNNLESNVDGPVSATTPGP